MAFRGTHGKVTPCKRQYFTGDARLWIHTTSTDDGAIKILGEANDDDDNLGTLIAICIIGNDIDNFDGDLQLLQWYVEEY